MMSQAKEVILAQTGYNLHVIQTEKYKTNTVMLRMKAPLSKETATYRSLLAQLLQTSTKEYKTTTELRAYLEELYGASLYANVGKKGENHIINLTLEIANEKFLSDSEPLLAKGLKLLTEVLIHPNTDGEAFTKKEFDQEKRNLKQRIESLYDDKMKYASIRLVEEMCENEPYGVEVNGSLDQLEGISPASLYEYYKHALETDHIDLYVIGDVEPGQVEQICASYLTLPKRGNREIVPAVRPEQGEVKEVKDVEDVTQGKLNIGYRTGITFGTQEYYALQVFNGIFGGFSHSKLFTEVREKNSLAYYCASRIESHKGLLMVMSGIQTDNYEKTVSIVKEQMKEMKSGHFSDEIMEQTKAVIRNQLLETIDNPVGLIEVLYHNVVAGTNVQLDDWLEQIQKVTKEEIIDAGKGIELDTIYFLAGKEGADA